MGSLDLRRYIGTIPGGEALLKFRSDFRKRRKVKKMGNNAKDVFSRYYETNAWDDDESRSGSGSTMAYTENIRKEIPMLAKDLGINQFLDAPCGDYNWFREVEWLSEVNYMGADIVDEMISDNQSKYGSDNTQFRTLNIIHDELPKVDLWLCRDCLFHLSNEDIFLTLKNFLSSDIPYLLTSTHYMCEKNSDIPTGSFRLLNLSKPPFNFPEPLRKMEDWIETFPERQLALWDKESLRVSLSNNESFKMDS